MAQINSEALSQALQRTAALVEVSPQTLAALRALVMDGTDQQLLHINPIEFALERDLDPTRTVTAFVGASKAGAFQFTWSLTCPLCGSYAHEAHGLKELCGTFFCTMCNRVSPAAMDGLVEVAFCIDGSVRSSPGRLGLAIPGPELLGTFQNQAAQLDPTLTEVLTRNSLWAGLLPVHSEEKAAVRLPARATRVAAITHNVRATLSCPPEHEGAVVELHDKSLDLVEYTAGPGVVLRNRTSRDAVCAIAKDIVEDDFVTMPRPMTFGPFLSGRDLLCNQAFRDLYASETLSAGIAVSVEAQTVLFTDLKGSTHLYDSIGDLSAFALVSEHFKILLLAVQQRGGAVVKTIGDAVMATFPQTGDAVRAALQMAEALEQFNASSKLPPLSLKIGLHVGSCIVVNSNDRPDYFGQTVNIAARVQALAEGDELVLTDAAWRAPGVAAQIEKQRLVCRVGDVSLKGVAEPVKVHTVRMRTTRNS